MDRLEWVVTSDMSLVWIYDRQLYELAWSAFPAVARPGRDVLRALLAYALDELAAQDRADEEFRTEPLARYAQKLREPRGP